MIAFAAIWRGGESGLTFKNEFTHRNDWATPSIQDWLAIRSTSACRLFGRGNDDIHHAAGLAPPNAILGLMQRAAYYLYVYTRPASYHLSLIEAMMAGMPILAPSAKMIVSKGSTAQTWEDGYSDAWTPDRYEVPHFLNEGAGLMYDTVEEGAAMAAMLQANSVIAAAFSARARERAIATFDADVIGSQWNSLFDRIC